MKPSMIAGALTLCVCGCLASGSFLSSKEQMPLHEDEAEMKLEVLKHITIGMPIDIAKQVMKDNGFKCRYEPYMHAYAETDSPIVLKCSRQVPYPFFDSFFISTTIYISVFFEEGKVKDIKTQTDTVAC